MTTAEDRVNLMLDQVWDLARAGNPTARRISDLCWMLPEDAETDRGPFTEALEKEILRLIHQLNRELNNEWRLKEPV
jgi:hypothetical protein